ncbi:hypothetical protein QVD17_09926 [Tagetes erecta]|uniref:Dof zinc finger protein n=1 Tax=Tagetes erecta TaxID=13708 RepID=A0AAD8P5R3_TARER|nr:hypothetical protein QVD17_09926 [Tagetes erecta]
MPSDSFDHRQTTTKPHHIPGNTPPPPPPPEPENLPCPRCDSINTKFCYYNNYNFSQPRHFCKSCRRYWTHGGTLRDIPIGGTTRKNTKRSRLTTTTHTNTNSFKIPPPPIMCDTFTSLLLNSTNNGPGFYGVGVDDYGFGRGVWPFSGIGDGGCYSTWQVESGGECLSLPELAISTPGLMM